MNSNCMNFFKEVFFEVQLHELSLVAKLWTSMIWTFSKTPTSRLNFFQRLSAHIMLVNSLSAIGHNVWNNEEMVWHSTIANELSLSFSILTIRKTQNLINTNIFLGNLYSDLSVMVFKMVSWTSPIHTQTITLHYTLNHLHPIVRWNILSRKK